MTTRRSQKGTRPPDLYEESEPTTILMVEDNPDHAVLARTALEKNPCWSIDVVATMGEAFLMMKAHEYQVLLVDYCLPDGYGLDLLDWVDESCTVVMMTAQGSERVAVEAFKRGALDYVVKDALFCEILPEIVEQALAKNKAIRQTQQILYDTDPRHLKTAIAYSQSTLRLNGFVHTDHLRTVISKFRRHVAEIRGCLRVIRYNPQEPVSDNQLGFLEAGLENCEQLEELIAELICGSVADPV
ncbi:MAG: response regulator [Candidatus Zixiibacteriota bacterium]|nr:MAG: response regulator [candidate division Zixibacteria bacterium]